MNIWQERVNNFIFLALCLVACFPALSMKLTVIFIIIYTSSSVLAGMVWNIRNITRVRIYELLMLLFPFLLILFRTTVTDPSPQSKFYLEVSMSLLAFPLAFFMIPLKIDKRKRGILNTIFIISTFVVVTYGLIKVAIKFSGHLGSDKFWKTPSDMLGDPSFAFLVRTVFEQSVSIHPTYASIFIGIAILILLDKLLRKFKTLTWNEKFLFYSSISLALLYLGILASRTPFIATMIAALVLFFMHLQKKMYALYVIGVMGIMTLFLILFVPSFSSRFKEISFSNTSLPTEQHENSFNLRTGIYKCSLEIISENWAWGVGPGNVQSKLNECYSNISKEVYDNKNYNTHNQFLDYWAGLGILGPVSLLIILCYASYRNFKIQNYLVISLCILFLFALLTENLLNRQNGIVPFAYFLSLYFFGNKTKETS
ncbi:MAG TPA: O-antigen ligase family protein [Bacteroidia bacterium]|nr:O-antigen ligase family protein [Bacteroidia bacterium]